MRGVSPATPPLTVGGCAGRAFRGHLVALFWTGMVTGSLYAFGLGGATGLLYGFFVGSLLGFALGLLLGSLHALAQAVVLSFCPWGRRRTVAPRIVHVVAVLVAYYAAWVVVVNGAGPAVRAFTIVLTVGYAVLAAFLAHRVLPRPPRRKHVRGPVAPRHHLGPRAL